MLRKKLRESLTARIFLLTLTILLAASGITFGLIAWATPMTYVTVMSNDLNLQAEKLMNELEHDCDYDTMLRLAGEFSVRTGAGVTIQSPEGERITLTFQEVYSGIGTGVATVSTDVIQAGTEETGSVMVGAVSSVTVTEEDGQMDGTDSSNTAITSVDMEDMFYSVSVSDREGVYTLSVTPSAQPINQAVEALAKVAPWLLCAMLLFSLLCAFGYSRYISRPILRLSEISQKMASMDFSWEYKENRPDEIGALGRNLNSLSRGLATALGELREANAALQRDIARERELEQQRLAFFSAASHELKTPVTILKGQLTGMLEGVDVYQDRDKYLGRALQVTGRMEHLVQELLTVSRMEASDFSVTQPLDLAELLREQLPLYTELAKQKGLMMETNIPDTLSLMGDAALLRRALDSILSNAILYSPSGETVKVAAEAGKGEAVLCVENSGVQLPQEALPHLFEAFYRVEQSRNRSTGGSGLGLYLTGRILQRHCAAYSIENTPTGVCFTVRFSDGTISTQNT